MTVFAISKGRAGSIEDKWPSAFGLAAVAVFLLFAPSFFQHCAASGWACGNAYYMAFDVSSLLSAFLFTFYGMVVAVETGFIGRLRATRAYRDFVSYLLRALVAAVAVTVLSVPLIIVEPAFVEAAGALFVVGAIWFGLTTVALASFGRAVWLFVLMTRVPDRKETPGG